MTRATKVRKRRRRFERQGIGRLPGSWPKKERSDWDSNPGGALTPTRFPDVLLQPLGHRSVAAQIIPISGQIVKLSGRPSEGMQSPGGEHRSRTLALVATEEEIDVVGSGASV